MSFTSEDFEQYRQHHALADDAARYIREAMTGPSRTPGQSSHPCVIGEYQSRRMGHSINTESRTGETAYAICLEYSSEVLAYYEQPPVLEVVRTTKRGTRLRIYYPDFLVLTTSGPLVVQVKTESELRERHASCPADWTYSEGRYADVPASNALSVLGLHHAVVSTADLNQRRVANLRLLIQAASFEGPSKDIGTKELDDFHIGTLAQLAGRLRTQDLTPILRLIDRGILFTDLDQFTLSRPESCLIARDPGLLKAEVYETYGLLTDLSDIQRTRSASQLYLPIGKHISRAVKSMDRLSSGAHGRSAQRWKSLIKSAAKDGISPLMALVPRYAESGNRKAKRPPVVLAFCENVIRTEWTSENRPTEAAMWRTYIADAETWHPSYRHVSKPTFLGMLKSLKPVLAEGRGGVRERNAFEPPTDPASRAFYADRPFELASCDHCLCKIWCIVLSANGLVYVDRPWLSLMRDVATGDVLSRWFSFRKPSTRSNAMLIRQCLSKHGRLPEQIIADRGPEFRSVYWSSLLAHCGIDLLLRPTSHCRYGGEVEGFFGIFKKLWLSDRPGNIVSQSHTRSVSGNKKPQRRACIELWGLMNEFDDFCEWHRKCCPPSEQVSPAVRVAEGLQRFDCSGIIRQYDDAFVIATAVDVREFSIDPVRGLHIGERFFWHPKLSQVAGSRKPLARRDPEDPYLAYALVNNEWVPCTANRGDAFNSLDIAHRLASSVAIQDCDKARQIAKEDAEIDLVRRRRSHDARRAPAPGAKPGQAPSPQNHSQRNRFNSVDTKDVAALQVEAWT